MVAVPPVIAANATDVAGFATTFDRGICPVNVIVFVPSDTVAGNATPIVVEAFAAPVNRNEAA